MADENKTSASKSSQQNADNSKSGEQQNSNNTQQSATFNPANYNDDPNNMANYTGNFAAGTYDTDYGGGEFPKTNAQEQGDNWVDKVGNAQQSGDKNQQGKNSTKGNQ